MALEGKDENQDPAENLPLNPPLPLALVDNVDIDFKRIRKLIGLTLSLIITDTAYQNICYPPLAGRVNNDAEHTAATALILTISGFIVVWSSLLFSMSLHASPVAGELEILKDQPEEWEKKRKELAIIFRNGLIIAAAASPPCMLPMIFAEPMLIQIFHQDKTISSLAQDFLGPYAAKVPAVLFWICFSQVTTAFRYTKASLLGPVMFGLALFFAIGLALGKMGMPLMGQDGILIGFIGESYLTAIFYALIITFTKQFRPLKLMNLWENVGNTWRQLGQQVNSSLAITTTIASELLLAFYLSVLCGWMGTAYQEAFALAMQYLVFCTLVGVSAALASAMVLGGTKGRAEHTLIHAVARDGLWLSLISTAIIPTICAAYPQVLMDLFSHQDPWIGQLLQRLTPLISLGICMDAAAYNWMIAARILGDVWMATLVRVVSLMLGAILATCLVEWTDLDIEGIGIGYCVAMALSALGLNRRFHTKMQEYRKEWQVEPAPSKCLSFAALPQLSFFTNKAAAPPPSTEQSYELAPLALAVNT